MRAALSEPGEPVPDCPFCLIVAGQEPADIIANVGPVVIFTPLNPVAEDHVLVVPRQHNTTPHENPLGFGEAMSYAAMYALGASSRGVGAYNIIVNAGAAATQTIEHVHIHLVPRAEGDGLALPWTGQHR